MSKKNYNKWGVEYKVGVKNLGWEGMYGNAPNDMLEATHLAMLCAVELALFFIF